MKSLYKFFVLLFLLEVSYCSHPTNAKQGTDISYFAGAPTMIETGRISSQTLVFNVGNIDNYSRRDMSGVLEKAKSKYPLIPDSWGSWGLLKVSNCHHFYINHSGTRDMGNFDITDPHQFSKAECMSRRQVIQMTEAMREFGNGDLRKCEIVGSGTQIGVRESRRIKGAYFTPFSQYSFSSL